MAELCKTKATASCQQFAHLTLDGGGRGQDTPSWLLTDMSEYEVIMDI